VIEGEENFAVSEALKAFSPIDEGEMLNYSKNSREEIEYLHDQN